VVQGANTTSTTIQMPTGFTHGVIHLTSYTSGHQLGSSEVHFYQNLIAPSNLHVVNKSSTTAAFTWNDNSDNETGFKVYQGVYPTPVATLGANVTSYTPTELAPNATYTYKVKAVINNAYNSPLESNVTTTTFTTLADTPTTPNAPTNLHSSSVDKTTATLTWTDNSDNETGFKVYQGTSTTPVATLDANVTSYTPTGLTPDTHYTYKVKAYNSAGESAVATTTFRTLQDIPPFTKAHITSPTNNSTLTSNTMTVTWDKNDASWIYLSVRDLTHKRTLFLRTVTSSTSKSVTVPTHGERIEVRLYSYNPTSHRTENETIYVTAKN